MSSFYADGRTQVGCYLNGPSNKTEVHDLFRVLSEFCADIDKGHTDNAERDAKVLVTCCCWLLLPCALMYK